MADMLKDAVASRLAGDRPSPIRAALVSAVAAAAAAAVTYRMLRS